ncbi:hypothetical protein EVAR_102271_1 [Eumeta japonica]|uniref:Uncharacterized protein n=1 Tax=Eumeta variegata TaxID=151549 RepID=A0A4C1WGU3_EUMVA|nr:hypothetical protein EVAR_102271_1 [Eumeta japonica]
MAPWRGARGAGRAQRRSVYNVLKAQLGIGRSRNQRTSVRVQTSGGPSVCAGLFRARDERGPDRWKIKGAGAVSRDDRAPGPRPPAPAPRPPRDTGPAFFHNYRAGDIATREAATRRRRSDEFADGDRTARTQIALSTMVQISVLNWIPFRIAILLLIPITVPVSV